MANRGIPTDEQVFECVEKTLRRLRRRRIASVFRSIQRATPFSSKSNIYINTASRTEDHKALLYLIQLNGQVVPVKNRAVLYPRNRSFYPISTNFMAPSSSHDDLHVPYLGDSVKDERLMENKAQNLNQMQFHSTIEMEDSVLVQASESPFFNLVQEVIKVQAKESEAECWLFDEWYESRWNRILRRTSVFHCAQHFGVKYWNIVEDSLSRLFAIKSVEVRRILARAVYESTAWEIEDVVSEHKKHITQIIQSRVEENVEDLLKSNSIPFFLCRQCTFFDCAEHGTNQLEHETTKRRFKFEVAYDSTRKDSTRRSKSTCNTQNIACSFSKRLNCIFSCQLDAKHRRSSSFFHSSHNRLNLAESSIATLQLLRSIFGDDSCRIASCLLYLKLSPIVTCSEIGSYLKRSCAPKGTSGRLRGRKRTTRFISDVELYCERGLRSYYSACRHDGPCTEKNCDCMKNRVHCEKYCKCLSPRVNGSKTHRGSHCPNSFPYCIHCRTGCSSNLCSCFGGRRECDPDFCKCRGCKNQSLRFDKKAKIFCGLSNVHGYGVFAAQVIKKGDLIEEYVGEFFKLSDEKSHSKEEMYSGSKTSFLFNLSDVYSLDATRTGNKARFINHSANANCIPKTKKVDGDIRLGIYATRTIAPGEEILFQYGNLFHRSRVAETPRSR